MPWVLRCPRRLLNDRERPAREFPEPAAAAVPGKRHRESKRTDLVARCPYLWLSSSGERTGSAIVWKRAVKM